MYGAVLTGKGSYVVGKQQLAFDEKYLPLKDYGKTNPHLGNEGNPYKVGIPIDSGMDLSIRIDKLRVFINKMLSTQSLINQLLIKRVGLSISVDSR
jgi:hypothetical protein